MKTSPSPLKSVSLALLALGGATGLFAAQALTPVQMTPGPGSRNVSPDTPIRLTFATAPTVATSGKIQIFDATTQELVETIDLSAKTGTQDIGGLAGFKYYPVLVSGNQVTIYPKHSTFAYSKSYYINIDAGAFTAGDSASAAIEKTTSWRIITKAAPPAPTNGRLTVAADGSGDFCTIQGAFDSIPEGNTTPVTVFVRKGTYNEIVSLIDKNAITLLGEDRKQTVIAYANNATFNPDFGGNPFGGAVPDPVTADPKKGPVYRRGLFLAHNTHDLTIANLTLHNTTPHGGSQSETIIFNGNTSARAILKDVDFYSFQDTIQVNGQAYFNNCYIEGDVDFMWGTGPCFFENCTARSVRSAAYYTQIRNPLTNHGYVYYHCTFDGLQGIMGNYLSRIAPARYPGSELVLMDCVLTSAVGPVAWQSQGGPEMANVHFWEYNSHNAEGKPTDVSFRLASSRQLKQPDDAKLIADYSNASFVLGNNWNPKAAAIFTAAMPAAPAPVAGAPTVTRQPTGEFALLGTDAYFTVAAGGSGPLAYQWYKDGTPLPGATAADLRIAGMKWSDAANYTVVVSNAAGSVTSDTVRLTSMTADASPAPQLPAFPARVYDVTTLGAVADGVSDNTAAIQKAIDTAVAAGGGIISFPAAAQPYLSGPIKLGNNINLQVDRGATLSPLPFSKEKNKPGAYPLDGARYTDFITATNAHDVVLSGGGTINGNGQAWWAEFRANRAMAHRPYLIRFSGCEKVYVTGLTLTNSPMFHLALNTTNNLTVFNLTIDSPEAPNTDGIDPSGSHQLFQNCHISDGDDNIVMKAGGGFCTDITVADCYFGLGHGMSVGGQSNRGLDGMTIKNCYFNGTDSGLRLKADSTQGGEVKNITYSNIVMENVNYPIVFYSYYKNVGNPGGTSGNTLSTPEKVKTWNATPPNSLATKTIPSWKNLTINNLISTRTRSYSIIWGLALDNYLIDNVKLNNVHITGGPGLEVYNASNVQLTGDTDVGKLTTANALVLTQQPKTQAVANGASATFNVGVAGTSGANDTAPTYQWKFKGAPLADGKTAAGTAVSGATTSTLKLDNVQSADAGAYTVTVSNTLDGFDVAAKTLAPDKLPVSATSAVAMLTIGGAPAQRGRGRP